MTTTTPSPDQPDDVTRGLAALEEYVNTAHSTELVPATNPQPKPQPKPDEDEPEEWGSHVIDVDLDDDEGYTSRVRKYRAEVAEAHRLLELQDDEAPLLVDSPKVRKHRKRAAEAARLHELAQDPVALAYRDAKVRRAVTVMVMSAAAIGLLVSSIGVQASVAKALELAPGSLGWWAAFGVEPALSLPLLAAVAAQAYSAIRGKVVDRKSPQGKKLFRTEALLLGLTLILNCWPALVFDKFDLLPLIVHSLGPIAAVTAVWVLPTLWQVLEVLPTPLPEGPPAAPSRPVRQASGAAGSAPSRAGGSKTRRTPSGGPSSQREEQQWRRGTPAPSGASVARGRTKEEHRAELHRLIAAGELPPQPSASRIQKALRCREELSRELRDELRDGGKP